MFADGGGDLWLIMTGGGVIILGLVLAYTMSTNRKRAAEVEKQSGMLTEREADRRAQG